MRPTSLLLACLMLWSGCARVGIDPTRRARLLMVGGAAMIAGGGAVLATCEHDGSYCRARPRTELALGVPLLVLGIGVMTTGFVLRPRGTVMPSPPGRLLSSQLRLPK